LEEDHKEREWEEVSIRSQEELEEELAVSLPDSRSEVRQEEEDSADSLLQIRTISSRVCSEAWAGWEVWVECRVEEVRGEKEQEGEEETLLLRWEEEASPEASVVWEWISTMMACTEEDQHRRNPLQKSVSFGYL
jgi:hypothetical protein